MACNSVCGRPLTASIGGYHACWRLLRFLFRLAVHSAMRFHGGLNMPPATRHGLRHGEEDAEGEKAAPWNTMRRVAERSKAEREVDV